MTIILAIKIIAGTIAGIFLLSAFFGSWFTVDQQSVAIVERFGKFHKLCQPGLNFKAPFIDQTDDIDLRVQELLNLKGGMMHIETKTKDDVVVSIGVVVQYFVRPNQVFAAYYQLEDAEEQMKSCLMDSVRAKVPQMTLNEIYLDKQDIAMFVQEAISVFMTDFGYGVKVVQITDVSPDAKVKEAMNEINASQRMRLAASEKGEADRILKVKAAEADAQSKALQGKGIADQRRAIIEGLRESVEDFKKTVPGSSAEDVMALVLMTQYFDTLKEISASSDTNTIFVPHSPGGMSDLSSQIRNAIMAGNAANVSAQ